MRAIELGRFKADRRDISSPSKVELGRYIGVTPLKGGPDLYALFNLRPAQTLRVNFHGALTARDQYPRFDRVKESDESGDSYISFADPTVAIDPELKVGWYLGGPDWDPLPVIADLVRRAARAVGATRTVIIGGSGGGFAALRLGLLLPDSLVYCHNPQTAILNYHGRHVRAYFGGYYSVECAPNTVVAQDPAKYDMSVAYGESATLPTVFYTQNLRDAFHIERHYIPFKRATGLRDSQGVSPDRPCLKFYLFDGERDGRSLTAAEFNRQYSLACQWRHVEAGRSPMSIEAEAPDRTSAKDANDGHWDKLLRDMSRLQRTVTEIQTGHNSQSLRRRLIGDLMAVAAVREHPIDRRPLLRGWSLTPEVLRCVLILAEDAPSDSTVIELGSGVSTVWIAETVKRRRGEVKFISFEHDVAYYQTTKRALCDASLETHADLRLSPLKPLQVGNGEYEWYSSWEGDQDVSLLLVDGPPGGLGPMARYPAIALIERRLMNGALVVVDDYAREQEADMVEAWNMHVPNVRLQEVALVDRAAVFRVTRK